MCKKMFILIVVLGLAGAAPATITEVNDTQTWITFDMTGGDWLVIGPDGDLTVTGESRVAFGPEGNPSKVIVNGGTLTLNNRLNTDGWAAIEMNGGYFRIGLGPEGSLKFPDNGGPVWIYLNDGVLSVHDCQNFVDRGSLIVVGYGVMQLDSTSCSQCNPNDWLSQGGIVPA